MAGIRRGSYFELHSGFRLKVPIGIYIT
jgi:hypothetical protein